jgi:hypothetical protein
VKVPKRYLHRNHKRFPDWSPQGGFFGAKKPPCGDFYNSTVPAFILSAKNEVEAETMGL